jgi:MarR-like DNA-binding transcriptional regulator SgrR of sgrS sRNA
MPIMADYFLERSLLSKVEYVFYGDGEGKEEQYWEMKVEKDEGNGNSTYFLSDLEKGEYFSERAEC